MIGGTEGLAAGGIDGGHGGTWVDGEGMLWVRLVLLWGVGREQGEGMQERKRKG